MVRGAWWAIDSGVVKSRTRLSDFTFTFSLETQSLRNMCFKSPLQIYLFLSTPLNKMYLSLSSFPLYENVSELTLLHHFPGPLGKTFADKNIHSFIIRIPSLLACAQSCLTPWDPMDYNRPGSSVHGIFQPRILERLAISSSRGSSQPSDWTLVSCVSCIGRQMLHHCATWTLPLNGW